MQPRVAKSSLRQQQDTQTTSNTSSSSNNQFASAFTGITNPSRNNDNVVSNMATSNLEDDVNILSKYFESHEDIPKDVRDAFVRVKQRLECKTSNEMEPKKTLEKATHLTREVLINHKWLFFNDNGFLGEVAFQHDGKLSEQGYTSCNERTWRLQQIVYGHTILEFYGDGNKKTCTFISAIVDGYGKWRLQGPFKGNKVGWRHYLHQAWAVRHTQHPLYLMFQS